jgi:hypothetical protein
VSRRPKASDRPSLPLPGVGFRVAPMLAHPATGSPTAVTHRRLPQNVACGCRDRNVARATVGGEFPVCTLSVVQRVPSSTMVHVSTSPPTIPDGRLSRVRFWPRLCTPFSGDSPSGVRRGLSCSLTSTPPRHRFVASSSQLSRGRLPSSVSGVLWRSSGPPSAQSPFAWDGRYPPTRVTPRSPQRVLPLFLSSYGLMRQTTVLLTPR